MGKLVEQDLPTLFGGVSTQPDSVRQPNQVTAMTNALPSVVTGGFEKRPGTQTVAALSFLSAASTYAVHSIDRDATEQTFLLAAGGEIKAVNAITGAEITVNVTDTIRYFLIDIPSINATGIVEEDSVDFVQQLTIDSTETAITWNWELTDASTVFKIEGSADNSVWNDISTGNTGATGSTSTTIDAVATGDHNYIRFTITTAAGTAADTITVTGTFKDLTYLQDAAAEDLRFVSVADNTFVLNRNVTARMAELGSGTITSTVQEFSDLPTAAGDSSIHKVQGTDTSGFGAYFVIDDSATTTYIETADPTGSNDFDASSMPHQLVREADGTYTYSGASWTARGVGDSEIVPDPSFIGKQIQDITFFRNRLTFLADEEVYCGQAGNVLDLWPEKAVEVLDTDPVTRAATTNEVNILKFATVFRKILFATSQRAQFELTSTGSFTPESALFDLATSYTASGIAKPKTMGDLLYFPSATPGYEILYEYFFDDSSLSNTAADVTKHVSQYIPTSTIQLATDPTTNTVFLLTSGEQNGVFVYRTFFDGNEKVMSSWGKYTLGATESAAFIHGMAVFSGFLVLIIERADGVIYLEQAPIERETQDTTMGYTPFLDQREVLTGTYDSTNDVTHWESTYEHTDDAVVIYGPSFSEPGRQLSTLFYPDRILLTLDDVQAGETITIDGLEFTAHATTTTVASREFAINGTDTADAGELVTCLNDGTYGMTTLTAVDNSDGTITVTVDDKADGSITTPTGTAITNATIVSAAVNDLVAARGDSSAYQCYVGRPYTMTVELSKQYWREQPNAPANLSGRLQLRDITFNLEETGYVKVTITPLQRTAFDYPFEGKEIGSSDLVVGAASIASETTMKVGVYSDARTVKIEIMNDQPQPSIVTSASWRGFFNEISRQG